MTRFNINMPKTATFPKDLDMEDAYGLLSEKTELYQKYVKAGDKENASHTLQVCNDIATHYDLFFVINDDHTKERKRKNYERLHAKLEQCMQLKKQIEHLVNQCVYTASPLGLSVNHRNWESVYQQCKLYLNTPDNSANNTAVDYDDIVNERNMRDWDVSGCSYDQEPSFEEYLANVSENEYFYASNYSCPDH